MVTNDQKIDKIIEFLDEASDFALPEDEVRKRLNRIIEIPDGIGAYWTWYHGTTRENSEKILREGFQPDSWFAVRKEDAYGFNNQVPEVIFTVRLPYCPMIVDESNLSDEADPETGRWWQAHVLHPIPPDAIVATERTQKPPKG